MENSAEKKSCIFYSGFWQASSHVLKGEIKNSEARNKRMPYQKSRSQCVGRAPLTGMNDRDGSASTIGPILRLLFNGLRIFHGLNAISRLEVVGLEDVSGLFEVTVVPLVIFSEVVHMHQHNLDGPRNPVFLLNRAINFCGR